ncbi:hypothetical protein BJ912DRAFT_1005250 [Pholiota molesta]|nr:hypothetical protein BJ912DRAFT_1005250 [Pholiota molesta]
MAPSSCPSDPASTSTPLPDLSPMSTPNPSPASTRTSHQFRCNHSSARKPAISSMDQLVANMVFHRQQEPLRKKPARARTWSPPAAGVPKAHPTPKSPLRQMLLPDEGDDEEMEEDEGLSPRLAQLVESPLPLSPLCLMETDLAPSLTYQ